MNCFYCFILLFISVTLAYPRPRSNEFDRLLERYLKKRSGNFNELSDTNSDERFFARRQRIFPYLPIQQYHPQIQPGCLPRIWTCGPGLPPCCAGLMCYDGNAKRGRVCVARG